MVADIEQLCFSKLLFTTKLGMVKKVDGSEFKVAKRTISATKLAEDDELLCVTVIDDDQNVVLQTKDGYFLRFSGNEIPEKKRAAIGVRGMKLRKGDELEKVYLFEEGSDVIIKYNDKDVYLNRLKAAKRDGTGTKNRG